MEIETIPALNYLKLFFGGRKKGVHAETLECSPQHETLWQLVALKTLIKTPLEFHIPPFRTVEKCVQSTISRFAKFILDILQFLTNETY